MNEELENQKEEPVFLSIYKRNDDDPSNNMWWIQLPSEKEAHDYSLVCKGTLLNFKFIVSKELNEREYTMIELNYSWVYQIMEYHFDIKKRKNV